MTRPAGMLLILCASALALANPAPANEALDILEGKKNAADVVLPPAPPGEDPGEPAEVIALDDSWAPGPLDPLWARALLYEDSSNPWLQALAVHGLFHFSGAWGHAEHQVPATDRREEADLNSTRTRRLRLGARMRAFYRAEIEASAEIDPEGEVGIDELKARVELLPGFDLSFGKMRPRWSAEYSTDPQYLLTPERSMLVDMLAPARTLGVMIDAHSDRWDYGLGWFSGDADPDLPAVRGDGFLLARVGYETLTRGDHAAVTRTRWHLDYAYNMDGEHSRSLPRFRIPADARSANGGKTVSQPWFRHLVATGVEVEQGRFNLLGEFLLGHGGTANVWGFTMMPSYWAIPGTLRVVGRYHYADTNDPGGLVTGLGRDPFFDPTPLYTGDEYHSFYLGGNLHLYQDQLVILSGLEYALLKDDAGGGFDTDFLIWHAAARLAF